MNRGRPRAGGGKANVTAFNSVAFPLNGGHGFYVVADAAAWVSVQQSATIITSMDTNAKATPIAANQLYGPFDVLAGYDTHVHVAGDGATANVVVTVF